MSLFQRGFVSDPSTSFTPLFRLLDEYGDYNNNLRQGQNRTPATRTFSPKFDVKETQDAYELHGELPGIEQNDVDIEFTDQSTLTVHGRSERSYTSNTPPAGLVEGPISQGKIEGGQTATNGPKGHQATVEDEPGTPQGQVSKTGAAKAGPKEPEAKFWVSERSVGEFSRSFHFPERVDQDAVRASMKNGILSVIVPKARKQEKRKITIS
jgi:HSP20 family molecular chaperone IbpA